MAGKGRICWCLGPGLCLQSQNPYSDSNDLNKHCRKRIMNLCLSLRRLKGKKEGTT